MEINWVRMSIDLFEMFIHVIVSSFGNYTEPFVFVFFFFSFSSNFELYFESTERTSISLSLFFV